MDANNQNIRRKTTDEEGQEEEMFFSQAPTRPTAHSFQSPLQHTTHPTDTAYMQSMNHPSVPPAYNPQLPQSHQYISMQMVPPTMPTNPYFPEGKPLWFQQLPPNSLESPTQDMDSPYQESRHQQHSSPKLNTLQNVKRFELQEQPSSRQRKVGTSENRWMSPNPFVIGLRDYGTSYVLPTVLGGIASVHLVKKDVEVLEPSNLFVAKNNQRLNENCSASFNIKLLDTLEGGSYRLLFKISYFVQGSGYSQELLFSNPFNVLSSRRNFREHPILKAIKPNAGFANSEEEVWIKGQNFCESVVVTFGGVAAAVVDTCDNLLCVKPPKREDLLQTTQVEVKVFNRFLQELLPANTSLGYTYVPARVNQVS